MRNRFSWLLRGTEAILEFRWKTKNGGTPRVYWFYDEPSVVVVSHGTNKKGDTDDADIRHAESIKKTFVSSVDETVLHQERTSLADGKKDVRIASGG